MTRWDEYFARYQDLQIRSSELDNHEGITTHWSRAKVRRETVRLIADFSEHYPPSSQEDVAWFLKALGEEQRKYFVAFVLREPRKVPEVLYEPMMQAAVRERDPSNDRAFVEPCMATFGLRRVNETLLSWFESMSDKEKAGAVQAMYWARLININESDWSRPETGLRFREVRDLWMRQRGLLLQEFIGNESILVRQRIIANLDLKNALSYPEQLRPFVAEAIRIARNHPDAYIRHRLEIQMGSDETTQFLSLPAMTD